jgi:predicted O-linked N-acetylglucosamine transferase (SPINDLY family)
MNIENFETASLLFYEGLKLIEKKEYHFAEELFRKSLFILPGRLSTIINLTAVLVKNSKYEEVINIINEVNDTDTNDPLFSKLYINLGNALKGLGKISDAIPIYCKATKIDPYSVEAFNNYGEALRELGLFDESEKKFSKCIELKPDYADAYSNLGVLMLDIGELKRSEKYLSRAISLSPDKSEYYCNLSVTLKLMGQYKNAESCIENAIKLNSTDSVAYCIHGNILTDLGLFKNAEIAYKKAITIKPEFNEAKSNLLLSMSYFSTNASSNTNSYNEAVKIGKNISESANPKFCNWNSEKINKKIRVGFVSGDFKSHPVGYFIQGLLKFIDRNEFEIFGFTTIPQKDKLTKIIKAYFTDWIPIYGKSDFEAANIMHKMDIHILIDLSGHTAHNRLGVF